MQRMAPAFVSICVLMMTLARAANATPLIAKMPFDRIGEGSRVTLIRDRPEALRTSRDLGRLNAGLVLRHVRLELKRSPEKQASLDRLTHDQHTHGAAMFHRWLTPMQLRAYGPAQSDIDGAIEWLRNNRLQVDDVSPSGMAIVFSGTAGTIGAAFHTQLHHVSRDGEAHVANVTGPSIPAALGRVVTGVTLANFFPRPAMRRAIPSFTAKTTFGTFYAVAPPDFATIYNVKPLRGSANFFGQPITGAGATVAVVEQTHIKTSDWSTFRRTFGLSGYHGKLSQIEPGGCASAGFGPDEGEAALDAEWVGAAAPDANVIEASCATTAPLEFGVETALQNLVELGTSATILSISYEGDEIADGFAFQAGWNNLVEEGAAEGKAIFVASGDNGVSADRAEIDSDGLFVNGLADTAFNVSVGGTDFYDSALGENTRYWHEKNTASLGSAISYIPEIPWNNSCAGSILWKHEHAGGPIQYCNMLPTGLQNGVGGSGSQSVFYPKPDWQLTTVLGVPNDGVRDQPDVSLFAANGLWGHFYVFCMSDANEGGSPCNYKNQNDLFGNAAGGTSFSSPAFAGIMALVQQLANLEYGKVEPLGNPNPVFYQIAKAQFDTPLGLSRCDSSLGSKISAACVFNYVTAGDIAEPCYKGTPDCRTSAKSTQGIGVLGADVVGKSLVAYPGQPGYSLATGLGTVNVANLLYNYSYAL